MFTLETYNIFLAVMAVTALFVFIALYFVKAGYGYLYNPKFGFPIPNKLAWVLMEAPVFITMWVLWYLSGASFNAVSLVLFSIIQIHYFQRSFIFPMLLRGNSKMPVSIMLMGATFNTLNALMQGGWLFYIVPEYYPDYYADWFCKPYIYIGIAVWLFGFITNLHSDYIIRHLRKPGDKKHYIPYGGMFRRALETFETIFVQNEESKQLLSEIGFENVIVAGDTRFDRAAALPAQASRYPLIEHFKGEGRLFIVGSSWRPDEDLLVPFVNAHPDVKFVIAPHEMEQPRIERLVEECTGGVVRYSECRTESDVEGARVLIVDVIGILNQLYQYADWVYIGGGFGVCIHNTQEPATYGVPIAFGPKYHKFKEACDMIKLGACASVTTTEELEEWFAPLKADEKRRAHFARIAADYITANKGATELIVRTIFGR